MNLAMKNSKLLFLVNVTQRFACEILLSKFHWHEIMYFSESFEMYIEDFFYIYLID